MLTAGEQADAHERAVGVSAAPTNRRHSGDGFDDRVRLLLPDN